MNKNYKTWLAAAVVFALSALCAYAADAGSMSEDTRFTRKERKIIRHLEKSVDGFNSSNAVSVLDTFHDRMVHSGIGCAVTGGIMGILSAPLMSVGGVLAFDKVYGNGDWGNTDKLPYFISGIATLSCGAIFGLLFFIVTPLCAPCFASAHRATKIINKLKGIAFLQNSSIDVINDGATHKIGLSTAIKI